MKLSRLCICPNFRNAKPNTGEFVCSFLHVSFSIAAERQSHMASAFASFLSVSQTSGGHLVSRHCLFPCSLCHWTPALVFKAFRAQERHLLSVGTVRSWLLKCFKDRKSKIRCLNKACDSLGLLRAKIGVIE